MSTQSYRDLVVWQKAMGLAKVCYELTRRFPREEMFGMTSQIRRAAASIPANLAEGNARTHTKEYLQHISIARGSLAELETHLILCNEVGLLPKEALDHGLALSTEVGRMLTGLRRSLESSNQPPS